MTTPEFITFPLFPYLTSSPQSINPLPRPEKNINSRREMPIMTRHGQNNRREMHTFSVALLIV